MKPARSFSSNIKKYGVGAAVLIGSILVAPTLSVAGGSAPSGHTTSQKQPPSQDVLPARAWTGGVVTMLEGAWRAGDGSVLRLGALDAATGVGSCEASAPGQTKRHRNTYRVTRADESSRTAGIEILFPSGPPFSSLQEWTLSEDGRTVRRHIVGPELSFLQMIRMDRSMTDTLTYIGAAPEST